MDSIEATLAAQRPFWKTLSVSTAAGAAEADPMADALAALTLESKKPQISY